MSGKTQDAGAQRALVAHVAALASLSLDEGEVERLGADLAAIVGYVEELSTLDTRDVPPTTTVIDPAPGEAPPGAPASLRVDEVAPSLSQDEALADAPDPVPGLGFGVPRFVGS